MWDEIEKTIKKTQACAKDGDEDDGAGDGLAGGNFKRCRARHHSPL
jgi:hypothetical protein